jgi:hypothetical protein
MENSEVMPHSIRLANISTNERKHKQLTMLPASDWVQPKYSYCSAEQKKLLVKLETLLSYFEHIFPKKHVLNSTKHVTQYIYLALQFCTHVEATDVMLAT